MPGPATDARAGELRERYRRLFGGGDVPVPVEAIAEDLLGLRVLADDALECSGKLFPARREIWLNGREARESPGRRRFTLAHELGHWVCQVLEGHTAPVYCRAEDVGVGAPRDPLEREANVFAAELLMPPELLGERFALRGGSVEAVAADFGVSAEAMGWRLYNAGVVPEPPYPSPQ